MLVLPKCNMQQGDNAIVQWSYLWAIFSFFIFRQRVLIFISSFLAALPWWPRLLFNASLMASASYATKRPGKEWEAR
jgi:hypothetical protein